MTRRIEPDKPTSLGTEGIRRWNILPWVMRHNCVLDHMQKRLDLAFRRVFYKIDPDAVSDFPTLSG